MENSIKLSKDKVIRELNIGTTSKVEEKDLDGFFMEVSKGAIFDTGLLPLDGTGTLALRHGLNHTQIVFQHTAGLYYMIWGKSERDTGAAQIYVAQPYRIVLGDLIDGELLGARHFYSPVPISHLDQPLYHCNVPNLNCQGYSGTSVGWICLYHKENYSGLSLGEKVFKVTERASGHEAYNDNNMSGTDGPRFYKQEYEKNLGEKAKGFTFLWNKKEWEKKSKEEGFEWTLNPDLWIPVKVRGIDQQSAHDHNGVVLTLRMAMEGGYHAYYTDETQPKPVNSVSRPDLPFPPASSIMSFFNGAFTKTASLKKASSVLEESAQQNSANPTLSSVALPDQWQSIQAVSLPKGFISSNIALQMGVFPTPKIECGECKTLITTFGDVTNIPDIGIVCASCLETSYTQCDACLEVHHYSKMHTYNDSIYCVNCHTVFTCIKCGHQFLNEDYSAIFNMYGCCVCNPLIPCGNCGKGTTKQEAVIYNLTVTDGNTIAIDYCLDCFSYMVICACGIPKHDSECATLPLTGITACASCIKYTPHGVPVYIKDTSQAENFNAALNG